MKNTANTRPEVPIFASVTEECPKKMTKKEMTRLDNKEKKQAKIIDAFLLDGCLPRGVQLYDQKE